LVYFEQLKPSINHMFRKYFADFTLTAFSLRADKCEFHVTSCEYLGYMLSPNGLMRAQNKVQIIQDWPKPRKVRDIQSFLGFTNFYRRFIHEYSNIALAPHGANLKECPLPLHRRVPFSLQYTQKGLHYRYGPDPLDSGHSDHSRD